MSVGSTINYTLHGEYANYVERVRVWIRPYESATTTNSTGVPATYAFPFDSRRPIENFGIVDIATGEKDKVASGAELVAETTDYTLTSLQSTIAKESGQYVVYLTFDIKSVDELTTGLELGSICDVDSYTKVGGVINSINGTNITTANAVNDGNRVLLTLRQTLFTPYDFYSKYYRIPCITTTSDGTLIAVSDARKYHAHDISNDIDMLVRRSTDNGKTWSAPIVVAHGQIAGTPTNMDHDNTIGYGDASIAALPNGKVLLCMVKGNRIAAANATSPTWLAYRVSNDNGLTWGPEKQVDVALLNNARGCIAPGNMCVVQEGVLKGKVLAAFRAASRHDQSGVYHGNFFLIFDPDTETWTRAYSTYLYTKYENTGAWYNPSYNVTQEETRIRYIYNSYLDYDLIEAPLLSGIGNSSYSDDDCDDSGLINSNLNGDDESVIVEIAPNKFLVSHRLNSSPYRAFTRLDISSTPGVETGIKYTPTELTSSGFTCTNANGSIIKATDANGETFLIHAVPEASQSYNGQSTRTGLRIYTTQYDGSSNTITWRKRVCLSDPFEKLQETAQYSSMTLMSDGTVGFLVEEYPVAVYATKDQSACANSDFIMRSVFMNVRPSDMIEEWGDEDYIELKAPVITPESQTYHSQAGNPRPEIVIVNPNVDADAVTTYNVFMTNANGDKTMLYENITFEGEESTISWDELSTKMGLSVNSEVPHGTTVIITAKCAVESAGKTYESVETQRNYIFKTPIRRVMIYARPMTGSGVGNPTIVVGSQTGHPGDMLIAGLDDEVTITAFAATENPMITFSHFAYPATSQDKVGTEITQTEWASTANVRIMAGGRQLVFNMKEERIIPSNYSIDTDGDGEVEDILILYVYYNSEHAGFKSQVTTSGHATTEADGYTLLYEENSSVLSTNDDVTEGFEIPTGTWTNANNTMCLSQYSDVAQSYVDENSTVNFKMITDIVYPYGFEDFHLNVAVQPDLNTAQHLNAVIMFIQKGQYLRNADGTYLYALLQGQLQQHDKNDPIYVGASFVAPWYGLNSDGVYSGMVAELPYSYGTAGNLDNENLRGLKFYNMQDLLVQPLASTVPSFYVMIYVISNLVTDIESLINTTEAATSAMYVHVHGIRQATLPTEIEAVEQADEMLIVNVDGGVQFIGQEPVVNVYNTMGVLVETFTLDGVYNLSLPQGIYIANEKKFVVK